MKQGKVEIRYDSEKLEAIKYYLEEKGSSLDAEMELLMQELYEKSVPSVVRSFIEKRPVTETKKGKRKNSLDLKNDDTRVDEEC
jgi:hypothetical protein